MGKIKIHEIAKELGLMSKDVVEKAKQMGFSVSSHMSSLEEKEADKLKKALTKKEETKTNKSTKQKEETPVIIRRQVIISEEEERKEKEKQRIKNKKVKK